MKNLCRFDEFLAENYMIITDNRRLWLFAILGKSMVYSNFELRGVKYSFISLSINIFLF